MNHTNVFKWYHEFKNDRKSVHNDWQKMILIDTLVKKIKETFCDNINEISVMFPQIFKILQETMTETLGFHKLCAQWVPK